MKVSRMPFMYYIREEDASQLEPSSDHRSFSSSNPKPPASVRETRIEVCFCASFLAQTQKERGATSGLIQKVAVQISLM
jgi:hypothetical protein